MARKPPPPPPRKGKAPPAMTPQEMAALDMKEMRGGRMSMDEKAPAPAGKRPVPPQFLKKKKG